LAKPQPSDEELKTLLAAAQKGKAELQDFIMKLQREMSEKDAYINELDGERREIGRLREETRRAEGRADKAEATERETRKKLAEAEGLVMRLRAGGTIPAGVGPEAPDVAALVAENEKLKQKEADSRAEAWKALKQRADAEAAAAEVREDTVRKLKDARKLASVELTRATEEAMKKAVTLKEDLARTERERKELIAEVKRLNGELETVRSMATAAAEAPAASAAAASAAAASAAPAATPSDVPAPNARVSALERRRHRCGRPRAVGSAALRSRA
jgi:septal ring factor EnvC (AmiA/AmiB activator)